MKNKPLPRVLIVGGGFAGLSVARELARARAFEITLIDRSNHHLFQPLLYQVAMAGLSPAEIAVPIRSLLSPLGVRVLLGEVKAVDRARQTVETDFTTLNYDYLVLACGAQHSYFGHSEWEEFAPGLKSLEQATEIRRRVLTAFELAERAQDAAERRELLTFIVVGGGPTGVELAGALGEISRFTLAKDFRHIDPRLSRVILIEAGPRILPAFSAALAGKATRDLERFGVQVWTNSRVSAIDALGVTVGAERLSARTVLWAAGVAPSALNRGIATELSPDGRVLVNADYSLPNDSRVFVIGDQAFFRDEKSEPLPGLAPVAMQSGRFVAQMIMHDQQGKARSRFIYRDKGQMATIGRRKAVAQAFGLEASGTFAWLLWLVVHIFYLIGFRNRVFVLLQWTWSYLRFSRGARLIVGKEWRMFRS